MPEYQSALTSVEAIANRVQPPVEILAQAMRAIQTHLPKYEWVGVYILQAQDLVLGPFLGAETEHRRIPVGLGVCGTAVVERRNQIIEDVRELSNYLACSASVRSEIVVLIWQGDAIVGQIDADSDDPGAFTAEDEQFLTQVARLLAPAVAELVSS